MAQEIVQGRAPYELDTNPDLLPYFDSWLLYRTGGKAPWELGLDLPRRRWREAAVILSRHIDLAEFFQPKPAGGCPLLDALGGLQ